MKTKIYFLLVLLFLKSLTFAQMVQNAAYEKMLKGLLSHKSKEISVSDAVNLTETIFVDTREKNEFDVSHIRHAVWSGYDDFNMDRLKNIDRDQKVVLYCSVGYRSEKIALKLMKYGFTNVWNLYGGIFEWKNQGNPVYDNSDKPTEKIHAYNEKWGQWLTAGEKVYNP